MLRYLLKRIFIFIPTLLVISLLAFGLSKVAPGDPVEMLLRNEAVGDIRNRERVYNETAHFLGLDKPPFYFALTSAAYPDTLYQIVDKDRREMLQKLIAQYGNWEYISVYYQQIKRLELLLYTLPDSISFQELSLMRSNVKDLYLQHKDNQIFSIFNRIEQSLAKDLNLALFAEHAFSALRDSYMDVKELATPHRLMIPDVKWYGFDNQYHNWLIHFIKGDFGTAYTDGRPVAHKINDALFWTLIINGIAILIAYLLAIPLGVFSAVRKDTFWDRFVTVSLFILYSLPVFWIATMLQVFFTTGTYQMDFFPSYGIGDLNASDSLWTQFTLRASHLILPIFCITYGSLAFISRQMRGGMLDVLQQDYIRTARAKGLGSRAIIWKHAFRNALFPIITLFASVFPAAFAGSVVIEVIYNIPGMGKLTIDAINGRDWPIVYTVLMISAILTMIGILIADILYALLDPRVTFSKK
ncbi:MAG: ABC transporter permease [Saprospiraceae bacterium]